jgi:hypothetical protein
VDHVVEVIRNKYVVIDGHHHVHRMIEARVRPCPVCEAFLNVIIFLVIFLPASSLVVPSGLTSA